MEMLGKVIFWLWFIALNVAVVMMGYALGELASQNEKLHVRMLALEKHRAEAKP